MATPNMPPGTSPQPVVLVPATLLHPNGRDAPGMVHPGTATHGITPTPGHTAVPIKDTTAATPTPMSPAPTTEPMTPTSTKTKKGCFGRSKKEKPVKMVDSRKVKHTKTKLWLWIIWLLMDLVSAAYCAIALVTFKNLRDIYNNRGDSNLQSNQLWGVLTATILTPALIVAYFVLGSILLARKTVSETGVTFTYGILTASAFWLSALVLLSTLVEHAYNQVAHNEWKTYDSWNWTNQDADLLKATWIIGYALTGLYFLLFLILLAMQKAVKRLNLDGATVAHEGYAK